MQGVENSKNCYNILNCCIYLDLFWIVLLFVEKFDDLLDVSVRYTVRLVAEHLYTFVITSNHEMFKYSG